MHTEHNICNAGLYALNACISEVILIQQRLCLYNREVWAECCEVCSQGDSGTAAPEYKLQQTLHMRPFEDGQVEKATVLRSNVACAGGLMLKRLTVQPVSIGHLLACWTSGVSGTTHLRTLRIVLLSVLSSAASYCTTLRADHACCDATIK